MENNNSANALIAEFMGLGIISFNKEMYLLKWKDNLVQPKDDSIFKFDSDWNWLMEVVEKINDGKIYSESREYRNFCLLKITDSIEQVYYTCIKFIEWYNENK